jgi:tryptophan-rich sensory protein
MILFRKLFAMTLFLGIAFARGFAPQQHRIPQIRGGAFYSSPCTKPGGSTSTSLHASATATAAWSALAHVVGGVTGAPIVAQATKRGSWYRRIDLPKWTPPDRIFAPVWTFLYASMGVAAARVYHCTEISSLPMVLWIGHYVLNLAWAPVFFGMKRLRLGMIINCALILSLAVIIPLFYQNDPLSGLLLVPYMIWVVFATVLNAAICKRNPTKKGYNEAMYQADLCQLQRKAAKYADGA